MGQDRTRRWVGACLVCALACNREHAARSAPKSNDQASGSATPSATRAFTKALDACEREGAVDLVHHELEIALSLGPPSLRGRGEIRVRPRAATRVIALDAHELQISEASAQGGPLRHRHVGGQLCLELRETAEANVELPIELAWQANPNAEPLHFSADQVWVGYHASAWMPTRQDPAQRATLNVAFDTPAGWKVAASGSSLARVPMPGGRELHRFALARPSPPFLYAFAAGLFDAAELTVDDVKLRALGPRGSDLSGALAITAPMYRFLRERLGAALPATEYVQVFVQGDAAQEAAGMALLSAAALTDVIEDPTDDWLFSHELAHQWFGWSIACADFSDFWLNEGLATFLVAAVKERRWGEAAYAGEVQRWRARSAKVSEDQREAPVSLSRPGGATQRAPLESELQSRGVTYYRGALVLAKLRSELGDELFWRGMRRYVADRAGASARTEHLRAAFEAASARDLRAFFQRWVYSPAPDL